MLQLEPVLDRRPSQLAEGEKQRVAVGRCIIRDPSCFLFDEPLSRLDVQLREEMRSEIKLVLQDLQRPTIIVTHDQLEALTMADRIAVMRSGIIEQVATPHGIFAKPANLFVAGFIGTPQMNLIAAELEGFGDDGRARFAVTAGSGWRSRSTRRCAACRPAPRSRWGSGRAISRSSTSRSTTGCPRSSTSSSPWGPRRWRISTTAATTSGW